jgi:hypothetical protein
MMQGEFVIAFMLLSYNSCGMTKGGGERTRQVLGGIVRSRRWQLECEPEVLTNEPQSSVVGMRIDIVIAAGTDKIGVTGQVLWMLD